MSLNQFTLGKEGAGADLLEFLAGLEPGSKVKLTLDNGVSKAEGEWIIDEALADRAAGRVKMEGGQDLGGVESEDDDEKDDAAYKKPKAGEAGAAALAVLTPTEKKKT